MWMREIGPGTNERKSLSDKTNYRADSVWFPLSIIILVPPTAVSLSIQFHRMVSLAIDTADQLHFSHMELSF